jgi:tetratricopeptide (TPR) repeat protein
MIEGSAYKGDPNRKALQARAREVLKQRDKATADYDHALALFPDQARLWLARGRRYGELKQWPKADADFAKAVELKPDDPQVWKERGRVYAELAKPDQAAADFAKVFELVPEAKPEDLAVDSASPWWSDPFGLDGDLAQGDDVFAQLAKLRPKDRRMWIGRVRGLARRAQWQKAVEALAKFIELDPSDHSGWYHDAILRLAQGDMKAYRRTCQEMLARFGQTEHAIVAARVVEICALVPGAVDDRKPLVKLAELSVRNGGKSSPGAMKWFHLVTGMAKYRDGQFAGAVDALGKCLPPALEAEPLCDSFAYLFLAMAQQRLGRADEARAALQKARELEQKFPKIDSGDLGFDWGTRLMIQVVRREAEALIEGPPRPDQKK